MPSAYIRHPLRHRDCGAADARRQHQHRHRQPIGDGPYDLWLWSGSDWWLIEHDWLGGATYQFDPGGVERFRVTGIEAGAGLDPGDGTAFVTAVSFTGAGQFTGTQTPLTLEVQEVPEPPVVALMLAGLVALAVRRRHRP